MKVYHSDEMPAKKRVGKRGLMAIGLSATLAVAALVITLTLVLGGKGTSPNIDNEPPASGQAVFALPLDEFEVGKEFSAERLVKFKTMGFWETHEAVDFLSSAGADVKAVSSGKVISVENNTSMYGTVVKIEHDDGLVSIYKGLASNASAKVGDEVTAGTVIGKIGIMTMEKNDYDKPHLHLEMQANGENVNPLTYLPSIGDK